MNRFRAAYAALTLLALAIGWVSYATLRDAPKRDTNPVWWRGLSKAEIAAQVESGRAPVRPDGAGPLVYACWPKGVRTCVVRTVLADHLVLLYFESHAGVWMLVHTEDLTAGSATHAP